MKDEQNNRKKSLSDEGQAAALQAMLHQILH